MIDLLLLAFISRGQTVSRIYPLTPVAMLTARDEKDRDKPGL